MILTSLARQNRLVCQIPVLLLAILLCKSVPFAGAQNFNVTMATYLGSSYDDETVVGLAWRSNGQLVVACLVGPGTPYFQNAVLLNGANASSPAGVLLLADDGQTVVRTARVGGQRVFDLALDANDNVYLAMGKDGVVSLSADLLSLRWSAPSLSPLVWMHRVDVGTAGTLAVLASNPGVSFDSLDVNPGRGSIVILDRSTGSLIRQITNYTGAERNINDIAVSDANGIVVAVGWKQATDPGMGGPVQIPCIFGLSLTSDNMWVGYDWNTNKADLTGRYLNEISVLSRRVWANGTVTWTMRNDSLTRNNMADCRLSRASIGEDGKLYVAGHSAGGNHVYRYSPTNVTLNVENKLANYDRFCTYDGARDQHLGFAARYTISPTTIVFEGGQGVVARRTINEPNTLHFEGAGVSGDLNGNIYLGGISASGLPLPPNSAYSGPRSGEQVFNPFSLRDYLGGAPMIVLNWNSTVSKLTRRAYCGRIAYGKTKAVAVRSFNGVPRVAFGGYADLDDGPIYVSRNAFQPSSGYGVRDGWLATYVRGVNAPVDPDTTASNAVSVTGGPVIGESMSEIYIRNSNPERIDGLDLDGRPSTKDSRYIYRFSMTDTLTPANGTDRRRLNFTYTGIPLYGGLVMDVANEVDGNKMDRYSFSSRDGKVALLWSEAATLNGQRVRSRTAVFAYTSDLFGPGIVSSFSSDSYLSFRFERFLVWVTMDYLRLFSKEVRFLVRDGESFWISEESQGWEGNGPDQFASNQLFFTEGPGRWAPWTPSENDVNFDASKAKFDSISFENVTAVGYYITDTDWIQLPWTKPVLGSNPPRYLTASEQPASLSSAIRLVEFAASMAPNVMTNRDPIASFTVSKLLVKVGEPITFDASASYDPDEGNQLAFYTWDFGDGTYSSGRVESKTFVSAGHYQVTLEVWDSQRAKGYYTRTVYVASVDANIDAQTARVVASWSGAMKNVNFRGNRADFFRANVDLDSDGRADDNLLFLPYADISRPLLDPSQDGTQLFGGLRVETRDSSSSYLQNWPKTLSTGNNNPAFSYQWDINGVRAGMFQIQYSGGQEGFRLAYLFAIDKSDFINGADVARVSFIEGTTLRAGPFHTVGQNAEQLRFAVREGKRWYLSEYTWQSPVTHANNNNNWGYANNSKAVLDASPSRRLRWAAWNPSENLFARQLTFSTRSFRDVTAFGVSFQVADWTRRRFPGLGMAGLELHAAVDAVTRPTPAAAFRASVGSDEACLTPCQVVFDASDSIKGGNIKIELYSWDFGDSLTLETSSPVVAHRYTFPGNFTVSLTIKDALDRSSTAQSLQVLTTTLGVSSPPTLGLALTSTTVNRGNRLQLQVIRQGSMLGTVSVQWRVDHVTSGPSTFTTSKTSGILRWASGDSTNRIISLDISSSAQSGSRFYLTLHSPYGAASVSATMSRTLVTVS